MSWRKGIATHSKFRNVYGEPYRKDRCYENIRVSKNAWDGTYCAINPKFLAVVLDTSGAGGAFVVIPLEKVGHQKIDNPRVAGHQREILDIQWNPFNDHIIASASVDTTIKIWRIPSDGLTEDLLEPLVDLHGHQRKVGIIRWHPTANGIIASAGFDFKVIVWNALKAKKLCIVEGHRDTIFDLVFNYNGSMMATTSKDKKIRIINSRTGKAVQTFAGHGSPKASHISFTDSIGDHVVTTGFSVTGERQISLWDLSKTSSPVQSDAIDNSSSILMLHYDMDLKIAYVAGKGDGMIRYYEIRREEPFLLRLTEYRHSSPQKSLGKMSKRGLDTGRCEIFRFYKMHSNNFVEPLPMFCPRRELIDDKCDEFQEDLYPPTPSMHPALTADEWISGVDKDPNLMSLQDGSRTAGGSAPTSPGGSSADKYNSMFNKPAKFEKQSSRGDVYSTEVNHDGGSTSPTMISKTVVHEVQAVYDEEVQKLKQLCNDQGREIDVLKQTISVKDERISRLERELASKNIELSDMREQHSKQLAELREANQRLGSRVHNGVSVVDGRTGREDATVTKTSQTIVQSMPVKQLVQESVTSSKKFQMSIGDHDIHRALEEAHREPECTGASHGKQMPSEEYRGTVKTGASYGMKSPEEEYRIEDIEAELESLREDLAKTREVRHGGKSSVRYVNEDEGRPTSSEKYSRTVTSDVASPRQRGYGAEATVPGNVDKRMVVTTASFARVPKHETSESSYGRQTSSSLKDKKVSKLIERFSSGLSVNQERKLYQRRRSAEILERGSTTKRSRRGRPKSEINFERWKNVLGRNDLI